MPDLRALSRELMTDAESDLGARLEWVAVDHWNIDNPHIHVLLRGRADDRQDLVVNCDYISQGLRERAAIGSRWNWGRAASTRSPQDLRRESMPGIGRASTDRSATFFRRGQRGLRSSPG